MKKSVKLTALFCAAALLASSMLSPMSAAVQAKAKKPALSKKKITITLGKTAKLKVKRAKGCKITWKSKKKKVVTVKKSGKYAAKLKAKKKGTAKVIATVKKGRKKYKLTCKVKVVLAKDDTSGITSNNPNVSTDASVTPTAPTQGNTDTSSSAPSVSPSGSPSDVPTAIPTDTSGVPVTATPTATGNVSATPTATGNVTVTPTQKPTVTPSQKPTQKPTAAPSQKPTVTPSQKPTATPSQKPTQKPTAKPTATPTKNPTAKPTATATAKPTDTATAKPTDAATANPTATVTPTAGIQPNDNAVLGSKVKWTADTVAAKVDETGAVVEFNESPQYRQADFLMASSVSLENIDSVEFTLSVKGEPNTVSFKLYDSDGSELKNMTQYNKASGTYTVKIKDEYKGKTITQYSIMTDTSIEGTTQTATAVLSKLSFISATGEPVVIPTATPTPASTPTPTPVPVVTPAPEEQNMTLSPKTLLASEVLNGTPTYNEDGSVTVTLKKDYGGGGIVFSISESKALVDLSNYEKVIFTLSTDEETPLTISAYRSSNFWDSSAETGSIVLSYKNATTEKTAYSFELTKVNDAIGFGVRYNASGTSPREEITLTIHSITLVKDERDIEGAITNYTSLAKLAASYGLKMGTVMNAQNIKDKKYTDLMKYHFNSFTAANEMKAYSMLNESASKEAAKKDANAMPVLRFDGADAIMDFAQSNGIKVRGHVLVWDAGMNDWFFREGYDPSQPYASAEVVKARLKNYIEQVLIHFEQKYPGVIYCWDVVNEAVGDSDSEYVKGDGRHVRTKRGDATNLFYNKIGEDYVELSFLYTYEAIQKLKGTYPALEDLKLYYNDYSTFQTKKRDAICELVKSINSYKKDESGEYIKLCDGVGMQSYIGGWGDNPQPDCMSEGDIDLIRTAILQYASLGVEVQATELAVRNFLPDEETAKKHGEFYKKLFQMYLELNSGTEKPLKAISIWGIVDMPDLLPSDYSYSMNGPYCGLFDDKLAVKPAFKNIHDLMKNGQ